MRMGLGLGLTRQDGGGWSFPSATASTISSGTIGNLDAGTNSMVAPRSSTSMLLRGSGTLPIYLNSAVSPTTAVQVSYNNGAFAAEDITGLNNVFPVTDPGGEYYTFTAKGAPPQGNNVRMLEAAPSGFTDYAIPTATVQCSGDFSTSGYTVAGPVSAYGPTSTVAVGQSYPAMVFDGTFTDMLLVNGQGGQVVVSVDGGVPTLYGEITSPAGSAIHYIPPSGAHRYWIWAVLTPNGANSYFGSGVFGTPATVTAPKLWHIGHSIVAGQEAGGPGNVDSAATAVRNGYLPLGRGEGGDAIADVLARLTDVLASDTVGVSDICWLDIGRNDGTTTFTTQQNTDLTSIISDLLTAGMSKVICTGVMPETANTFAPVSASIEAVVDAMADSRVVFAERTAYTVAAGVLRTTDGVHPDLADYRVMNTLNITYLDPYIP